MAKIKLTCGKCNGSGFLSHYRAISGGTCFSCNGKGYYFRTEKAIQDKQNREKAKNEKAAKIKEYNENKMEYFLEQFKNDSDFLKRMNGMDPLERGYQLAFNIMSCYEAWGRFEYKEPQPK